MFYTFVGSGFRADYATYLGAILSGLKRLYSIFWQVMVSYNLELRGYEYLEPRAFGDDFHLFDAGSSGRWSCPFAELAAGCCATGGGVCRYPVSEACLLSSAVAVSRQ